MGTPCKQAEFEGQNARGFKKRGGTGSIQGNPGCKSHKDPTKARGPIMYLICSGGRRALRQCMHKKQWKEGMKEGGPGA
eukprot:1162151-Pelagomonas_calceolata.AAC.7